MAWSLNVADGIYESQKVFLTICCIVYFLNLLKSDEVETELVKSIIVASYLAVFYAFWQFLKLPTITEKNIQHLSSFFEHRNLFSSILMLSFSFSLYGAVFFKKYWRFASVLLCMIIVLIILFLKVRSVYLGFFISIGLLLGFVLLNSKLVKKHTNIFTFFLFLIGSVVGVYCLSKLNKGIGFYDASGEERLKIWCKTAQLIRDHFWFGTGAGNWQYNFSKYGINDVFIIYQHNHSFQRPHNDFLWIISETGFIGFIFISLIMLFISLKSIPQFFKKEYFKPLLFFSFLIGLLIDSFFSFPKERIVHIVLASLMLSLLLKHIKLTQQVNKKLKYILTSLLLILLLFNVIIGFYRIKGEYYTQILIEHKNNNQPIEVIQAGEKAISIFYKTDPTSTPIINYVGWAYNLINDLNKATSASKQAYLLSPYDYEILSNYGYLLGRNRKNKEAKEILLEALRINSTYEPSILNMAIVEFNSGNFENALNWITKVPDYNIRYKEMYSKMLEEAGKRKNSENKK